MLFGYICFIPRSMESFISPLLRMLSMPFVADKSAALSVSGEEFKLIFSSSHSMLLSLTLLLRLPIVTFGNLKHGRYWLDGALQSIPGVWRTCWWWWPSFWFFSASVSQKSKMMQNWRMKRFFAGRELKRAGYLRFQSCLFERVVQDQQPFF